jgi:hypothetical protein
VKIEKRETGPAVAELRKVLAFPNPVPAIKGLFLFSILFLCEKFEKKEFDPFHTFLIPNL